MAQTTIKEAVRQERERIVAFIRMKADKPWHVDNERAIVQAIAAAVEAGEHHDADLR